MMSVDLVRFLPDHILAIPCTQVGFQPMEPRTVVGDLGPAFTLLSDGRPAAAGGLIDLGGSRAMAWAWIGPCGPALFLRVHRLTLSVFEWSGFARIEAVVRRDWAKGHRWARLLRMRLDSRPMSLPGGVAASLYVREH